MNSVIVEKKSALAPIIKELRLLRQRRGVSVILKKNLKLLTKRKITKFKRLIKTLRFIVIESSPE